MTRKPWKGLPGPWWSARKKVLQKLLALQHPFFRLSPIERFLLTALHLERWSYSRVARVMGVEMRLVAPWAWATRMKLIFQESPLASDLEYPKGPTSLGPSCPDFDISQPWTQRLLDDECEKRERAFLQAHLMACSTCRKSLESTRRMVFHRVPDPREGGCDRYRTCS